MKFNSILLHACAIGGPALYALYLYWHDRFPEACFFIIIAGFSATIAAISGNSTNISYFDNCTFLSPTEPDSSTTGTDHHDRE